MNKGIMTENSIQYTLRHLFKIANLNGNLLHEIRINKSCREVTVVFNDTEKRRTLIWLGRAPGTELINANRDVRWIDNAVNTYKIPILFWVNDDLSFVTSEAMIVFHLMVTLFPQVSLCFPGGRRHKL